MTQHINLPESWYEATAQRPPLRSFQGAVDTDVCVIGGGFAGLTTALELSRAGKSVVLLEAGHVACGASGRNGGFVSDGFALGIDDVAGKVGLEASQKLYALSKLGTEFVRTTIAAHEPSLAMGQGMRVCVRHDDRGGLHDYAARLKKNYGVETFSASTGDTRAVLDTQRYFNSIQFPRAFHIHPLRYALLLQRMCEGAGASVFEKSAVTSVEREGSSYVVQTNGGRVRAQHVVHCVSSLGRDLHRPSGRAVLPVATYVAVTEPLQQSAIKTREAIVDTRRAGDYYRLVDEGRILWGGRITTAVQEPHRLAEEMRGDMLSVFPQLGNPRIDYAWSGLMGYALHKMPLIGRDHEGQWFATAFGGHGLNTTAMAGGLIARAIAGKDDEFRRFTPFAPRWAFGQLGRVGVQTSYWWMQLRDRLDEGRGARKPA